MHCQNCFHKITPDLNYCLNCGTPTGVGEEQETLVKNQLATKDEYQKTKKPTSSQTLILYLVIVFAILLVGSVAAVFYAIGRESNRTSMLPGNLQSVAELNKSTTSIAPQTPVQQNLKKQNLNENNMANELSSPAKQDNSQPPGYVIPPNSNVNRIPVNRNYVNNRSVQKTLILNEPLSVGAGQFLWKPISIPSGGVISGRLEGQGGLRGEFEAFILDDSQLTNLRNNESFGDFFSSKGSKVVVDVRSVYLRPGLYYLIIRNPSSWTSRSVRSVLFVEN